jgi:hypothetical protein
MKKDSDESVHFLFGNNTEIQYVYRPPDPAVMNEATKEKYRKALEMCKTNERQSNEKK